MLGKFFNMNFYFDFTVRKVQVVYFDDMYVIE